MSTPAFVAFVVIVVAALIIIDVAIEHIHRFDAEAEARDRELLREVRRHRDGER